MEQRKFFTRNEAMQVLDITDKGRYYYALRILGIQHNEDGKINKGDFDRIKEYRTHGRFTKRGRVFGTLQKR